jgi:hypothetical protein
MGAQKSVADRRSRLSAAAWDAVRGRFVETPLPHPFASRVDARRPAAPAAPVATGEPAARSAALAAERGDPCR